MSNCKWVRICEGYEVLRREDFSSFPSFEVNLIDPILMKKLKENRIGFDTGGGSLLGGYRDRLFSIEENYSVITAPLYEYNSEKDKYVLISDTYTGETIDPIREYERIKETYARCKKEVAEEQKEIFERLFEEASIDGGISSRVTISTSFYEEPHYFNEKYVPEEYVKVCERNCPFSRYRHEVVFIRKMDAKGKNVTIKIHDFYKGLVIGKGGENIKRIAKAINAKRINVI